MNNQFEVEVRIEKVAHKSQKAYKTWVFVGWEGFTYEELAAGTRKGAYIMLSKERRVIITEEELEALKPAEEVQEAVEVEADGMMAEMNVWAKELGGEFEDHITVQNLIEDVAIAMQEDTLHEMTYRVRDINRAKRIIKKYDFKVYSGFY